MDATDRLILVVALAVVFGATLSALRTMARMVRVLRAGRAAPPDDAPRSPGGEPLVRVFDADQHRVFTMPARELVPGMVNARMQGVGDVWVFPSQFPPSDYRHPPFDEDLRDGIRRLQRLLDDVQPMSLEEWEDGFRRDRDPRREIAAWLHAAEVYRSLTRGRGAGGTSTTATATTAQHRRDVYRLLVTCMSSPRARVFDVARLGTLTRAEAEAVVRAYYRE